MVGRHLPANPLCGCALASEHLLTPASAAGTYTLLRWWWDFENKGNNHNIDGQRFRHTQLPFSHVSWKQTVAEAQTYNKLCGSRLRLIYTATFLDISSRLSPRAILSFYAKLGYRANISATFASVCADADHQLFTRLSRNSQHLHPLLPPKPSWIYFRCQFWWDNHFSVVAVDISTDFYSSRATFLT